MGLTYFSVPLFVFLRVQVGLDPPNNPATREDVNADVQQFIKVRFIYIQMYVVYADEFIRDIFIGEEVNADVQQFIKVGCIYIYILYIYMYSVYI